jgi:D-alanyl-D-alanine carboxypeptidase
MRRRALTAAGAVLAAAALLVACAPDTQIEVDAPEQAAAELPEDTRAQLDAAVQNAMAATASTGAIVGVWAPWSGSWVAGIGADAAGTPVDADMSFRVADVTRIMTCDVLYAVADDGIVELDDPVVDYVAGYPNLTDVTLQDLCDGTAGIGNYEAVIGGSWIDNPERVWDPLEIAAFGLGQPRSAVGTEYRNSDAGYALLGMALERATTTRVEVLFDRYLFEPLGLESTSLPGDRAAAPGDHALPGYRIVNNPDGTLNCAEPRDMTVISASLGNTDSGVVSTVTDLGRYVQAVAVGATATDADRWAEPLPVFAGAPGWFTATGGALQAGSLIGQYGSVPGYMTAAFADPATGMTVVVVLNNSTASADVVRDLSWELAAIASKAPATSGFTAPEFGLPWTAEQYRESVSQTNICR